VTRASICISIAIERELNNPDETRDWAQRLTSLIADLAAIGGSVVEASADVNGVPIDISAWPK